MTPFRHVLPLCLALLAPVSALASVAPAVDAAASAPREVAFDDLVGHVGEHVRVTTTLGTVRGGVLTGFSPIAINLRLDERDIVLGMPRETILKVELVAAAAAEAGR